MYWLTIKNGGFLPRRTRSVEPHNPLGAHSRCGVGILPAWCGIAPGQRNILPLRGARTGKKYGIRIANTPDVPHNKGICAIL